MKKLTLRTEDVLKAHNVLNAAKYGKLEDADKVRVWKIGRQMKPVADAFDDATKDAAEKMKPTEDFTERLQKAQEYEQKVRQADTDAQTLPMGAAEYDAFIKEFKQYNELVGKAVKEQADKEVTLEFEPLSEEAFGRLMASNEWTVEQALRVGELVCE
ncbi:MAG: hypothetical protein IJ588_12600 [Prevotella sp.]|nr:hypothetical protein [Prevotella sp.]